MNSAAMELKCQTAETNAGYPIVCISAEIMLGKRGELYRAERIGGAK